MPTGLVIPTGREAFARLGLDGVRALTEAAVAATFVRDGLTPQQLADVARIVRISGPTAEAAADGGRQHLACAFAGERPAGFVIATRHAPGDHELDWLMVHPDFHGTAVSGRLMDLGMDWLGRERPMWLTVLAHNARAIRFYRRFGFEIDPATELGRVTPSWVMRRPGGG